MDTSTDVKLLHIWGKLGALSCPCHKPPTHLTHEGFIDDVACRAQMSQYWFLAELQIHLVTVSSGQFTSGFSHNLFWISVLLPVSVLPNWISWPTAHLWYVQPRKQFQEWQACICTAELSQWERALHVESCAWGANFLLNTFKSPGRLLTHPWLQLCCPLLQLLEQNGNGCQCLQ